MFAILALENSAVVRLTASFYVSRQSKQSGIEFHGDEAPLHLETWFEGNGRLELAEFGKSYEPLPEPAGTFEGVDYGLGLEELAAAIAEDRASGALAAHVAEVVEAIGTSASRGQPITVESRPQLVAHSA